MITRDIDGVPILDFAGAKFRERLSAWDQLSTTLDGAARFIAEEYTRFLSVGDRKHALRYAIARDYLRSADRHCLQGDTA